MVNIIKQEMCIEESLKKKINFICEFANTTPTIINGSIRKIDNSTKDIKDTIDNLKKAPLVKNTYTISEIDKNRIIDYIEKVDKTNNDFKNIQELSVSLNNVDSEQKENKDRIKILTENNEALELKVNTLTNNIERKNKEIKELKKENSHLQEIVNYFKDLFNKLLNFIKDKMLGSDKEREMYFKVSKDLYNKDIFDDTEFNSTRDDYSWSKERENKEKDDFDI